MEKDGDGNPTPPSHSPVTDHGASSASTEGVEAAGSGANAAPPESSETYMAPKLLHEGSSSTSAGVGKQKLEEGVEAAGSAANAARAESSPRPNLEDALAFMRDLKERAGRTKLVDQFVTIMEDFTTRRQSTIKCVESAKELLKDHPELIRGFNTFLPDELTAPRPPNYYEALPLIARVKHRFMRNEYMYDLFLELINKHLEKQLTSKRLWEAMTVILRGHPDLLEGFRYFLPPHHPSKTGAFKLKIGQVEETGLDTLLRKVGSIIRKVEKMMKLIQSGQVVKVEDHLKYPDVKFLGELYGDLSLVLDDLSEKTAATLPVLHACLQEEEEELFRRIAKSEEVRSQFYEFLDSGLEQQDLCSRFGW